MPWNVSSVETGELKLERAQRTITRDETRVRYSRVSQISGILGPACP